MFTSYTLNLEIARQRQSEALTRSDRHHCLFRRRLAATSPMSCDVIDMPASRGRTSAGESLVA